MRSKKATGTLKNAKTARAKKTAPGGGAASVPLPYLQILVNDQREHPSSSPPLKYVSPGLFNLCNGCFNFCNGCNGRGQLSVEGGCVCCQSRSVQLM